MSRASERFTQLHAAQLDHARVVFCYAPAERSLAVIGGYLTEATATEDQRTAYGVELSAQVAVLEERATSGRAEQAWSKATQHCKAAGIAACDRESLKSLAEAACAEK